MRIKSFKVFESSDIFFHNDQIVKLINKGKRSSGEFEATYMTQDGQMHGYVADTESEFSDDFIATSEPFILNKVKQQPQIKTKTKDTDTFDIVYYYKNRKSETLRYNLPKKLAYALKNTFKKDPKYQLGELKVEPNQ